MIKCRTGGNHLHQCLGMSTCLLPAIRTDSSACFSTLQPPVPNLRCKDCMGMRDILRDYAFSERTYTFVKVLEDYEQH